MWHSPCIRLFVSILLAPRKHLRYDCYVLASEHRKENKAMAFKKLEGLTKDGNPRTLFRAIAINAAQFKLTQEIIALYEGETKLTRKQCRDAHSKLRPLPTPYASGNERSCPYFISKNMTCKTKAHGIYDLSRLKLAKGSVEVATVETPTVPVVPKPKRESKPKREAKAKRGAAEPKLIEAPVVNVDQTIADMAAVGIESAE